MADTIHSLIEHFGLPIIFLGCLLEGETVAILGGFFAHQDVLVTWQVVVAVYVGAFCGDAALFFAGKYFATSSLVRKLEQKPVFSYAQRMVGEHPALYVLLNRYVYGLRTVGGVVAGLADIRTSKFLFLNSVATLVWTGIFIGVGYVFGTAAEQVIGAELAKHERLLVALGIGVIVVLAAALLRYSGLRRGRVT